MFMPARVFVCFSDALKRLLSVGFSGIWPENADGTDVNTCARSHSSKLLVTGDDFGKVKLFSYPASQPKVSFPVLLE